MSEELSVYLNHTLDYIGYSKERIRSRATSFEQLATKYNEVIYEVGALLDLRLDIIATGSRAEGTAQMFESDLDIMNVIRNFLCVDAGHVEGDITIVQTQMAESPPGYTKLIPLDLDMDSERFSASKLAFTAFYDLQQDLIFLSSSNTLNLHEASLRIFGNRYDGVQIKVKQRSGPSVPMSMKFDFGGIFAVLNSQLNSQESDNVLAMPYFSSTILKSWSERCRKSDWPPRDVIDDVSTMEGYVVPIEPKFSEEHNLEWRISYTTAEKRLVSSLNPVQLKLYVLMKMIFKQRIKHQCDIISSYMLKNIIFWISECTNTHYFTPNNLAKLLCFAFAFLLHCLNANFVPNYMIPNSNLLLGKGSPNDKIKLRQILQDILNSGAKEVLELDKISRVTNVILRNPALGKSYGEWRDKLEKLVQILGGVILSKISLDKLLQPSYLYDLISEAWKEPLLFDVMLSLLKCLNVDILQMALDPVGILQYVNTALKISLS